MVVHVALIKIEAPLVDELFLQARHVRIGRTASLRVLVSIKYHEQKLMALDLCMYQ